MCIILAACIAFVSKLLWKRIGTQREKVTFLTLTVTGWIMASILIINPEFPGIVEMLDQLFHPFIGNMP
jgi:hypothetical protein